MTPSDLRSRPSHALIRTVITSYGDGHNDAPRGDALRVDTRPLRNPPDDLVVRHRMLHSNGLDPQVRDYVLASPGAAQLIERSLYRARTLLERPNDGRRVDLHVLCGGGRHRSVVVAEELATRIRRTGCGVETEHLHIDRPILHVTWQLELTDHQLLALRLLARGHTHTQIAVILRVKPETAGQLIHGVRTALRARTLPHAVAIGSEIGLLGQPRSS